MKKENNGKGFARGALLGGLIAGVAALLLAPKSGRETQEDIKRGVKGVKNDMERMLRDTQDELTGRIDTLKETAKDLGGEAKEESRDLVKRAEVLKNDLAASAKDLGRAGTGVKDGTVADAKRLVAEGAAVMKELERVTKKMVSSTKDKVSNGKSDREIEGLKKVDAAAEKADQE